MSASKRGSNWTIPEDEALCLAWLNTSQDASVGINQRSQAMYDRVYGSFLEICTEKSVPGNPELRAPSGINARWHHISKMVSKFVGCLAQIENRCPSGATSEDFIKQAVTLFALTEKSFFTLMHCYVLLQNAPKWLLYHCVKAPATQKRGHSETAESAQSDTSMTNAESTSTSRPIGQKAAKGRKIVLGSEYAQAGLKIAKAGSELAAAAKERLTYSKQKAQALSRMANHTIMSMNLDGLNETARKFYLLEPQRVLAETRQQA
ncbi:uncharacterized protein LOC129761481 [Toxorhynchites rutilus septentrionalis]|uniref:uncharacterized protein LOC129761481 n=1 Tax=Toxorhynchites rutilus septentrionalis TaxID=329112 RepID=UPI002478B0EE|nr:uncharacterized protein LOC129761481 [Toxorhynchites rutilus septentrionalis]